MIINAQQQKGYDFALSTVNAAKVISTPFLNRSYLSSFTYARIYKDQSLQAVHSEEGYARLHFELDCSPMVPIPLSLWQQRSFFYLAKSCNDEAYKILLRESSLRFNCDNPLYLVNQERDYIEVAVFCAYFGDNNVINYYLNNINQFKNFVEFFRKKIEGVFHEGKNYRLILPKIKPVIPTALSKNNGILEKNSSRETECIKLLCKGYQYKDIAIQLKISPRTVESHINNVKIKLNVFTRSDLIDLFNPDQMEALDLTNPNIF